MQNTSIAATVLIIAIGSGIANAGSVTIPNLFVAGTPAKAADVNSNFSAVAAAVNASASDVASLQSALQVLQTAQAKLGITYRGPWNAAQSYSANDIVSEAGSTYIALSANSAVDPSRDIGGQAPHWAVFAAAGSVGLPGPSGPQGVQGATGPSGAVGPIGLPGSSGVQGPAGPTGAAGATGATGPIGLTGSAGTQGLTGTTGGTGPMGPSGAAGSQGPAGGPGVAGPIGPAGPTGTTGASGSQGPIGPQGTQGTSGPQGSPGATGAIGPQGPSGPSIALIDSTGIVMFTGMYWALSSPNQQEIWVGIYQESAGTNIPVAFDATSLTPLSTVGVTTTYGGTTPNGLWYLTADCTGPINSSDSQEHPSTTGWNTSGKIISQDPRGNWIEVTGIVQQASVLTLIYYTWNATNQVCVSNSWQSGNGYAYPYYQITSSSLNISWRAPFSLSVR